MMNKLFKVLGGLLAAVAMMLGFLGVGTAHADEVIDNGGIVTRALENSTAVYAELDARNSPVGLDSAGDTLWVRFVQNGVELSSVPSPFQPRQRNVLQLGAGDSALLRGIRQLGAQEDTPLIRL